jgi:hypothetical protein
MSDDHKSLLFVIGMSVLFIIIFSLLFYRAFF